MRGLRRHRPPLRPRPLPLPAPPGDGGLVPQLAILNELQNPDTKALVEKIGEGIVLGRAMERDSAGPKVFAKLLRYEALVQREFQRAKEACQEACALITKLRRSLKPKPQPQPEAQTPRNAPCPCGSGLKHKRCCGAQAPAVLCAG